MSIKLKPLHVILSISFERNDLRFCGCLLVRLVDWLPVCMPDVFFVFAMFSLFVFQLPTIFLANELSAIFLSEEITLNKKS